MADPEIQQLPALTAERTSSGTYVARNERGAEVQIGMPGASDSFSPVELLQAAIAGCAALSAESKFVQRLGEDFTATATVEASENVGERRVEDFFALIEADMSELDQATQDKLMASAQRSIDRLCAIKRTLGHGATGAAEVRAESGDAAEG